MDISSNLSWGSHIDRITGIAHKTPGFVQRSIRTKLSGVREAAYTTLVRPQLEYAAAIWDPHHKDKIEKVQRRAARWTSCNFDTRASISDMLETRMALSPAKTCRRTPSSRLITSSQTLGHSRSFCQLHWERITTSTPSFC